MTEKLKLLLIDDEVEILNALKRVLRKDYDVSAFNEPDGAIQALKDEEFAIIISDMKMPIMDGATFLTNAKEISPDSVRILLTGYSDMDSTARAINEANIFSYASKPWNNEDLKKLLENATEHYLLKKENKELTTKLTLVNRKLKEFNANLELKVKQRSKALAQSNTKLKSSIHKHRSMFQQILDMVSLIIEDRTKDKKGHNKRVALHCKLLAEHLGWDRTRIINTYIAALVHDVGMVALPDELLELPELELNQQQLRDYRAHAEAGADIIQQLPQLELISNMVRHQYMNMPTPEREAKECPTESRLIRVVADYDAYLLGLKTGHNLTPEEAINSLKENVGYLYDGDLLESYQELLVKLPSMKLSELDYCLTTAQLEPGMSISEDIINKNGSVLLATDAILSENIIEKLKQYEKANDFQLTIYVY